MICTIWSDRKGWVNEEFKGFIRIDNIGHPAMLDILQWPHLREVYHLTLQACCPSLTMNLSLCRSSTNDEPLQPFQPENYP